MRYVILVGVLAFALYTGVCGAEDGVIEKTPALSTVTEETEGDAGLKHIDVGDDPEGRLEEPVTQVGVMSPGESYDEDTGLPDVVESDSGMELE